MITNEINNEMKKCKYIVLIIACFVFQLSVAQTPQHVESFVMVPHNSQWYSDQAKLWKREVNRNKQNEKAWENYFRATKYSAINTDKWNSDEINRSLETILKDMKKVLPNSYTYNILMYYNGGGDLSLSSYIDKAIEMRPDEVRFFPDYVAYAALKGNTQLLNSTCKKWYESGTYSPGLLNYAYNELVGMDSNAIVFANGDATVYPKLILQNGKSIFVDKKVICTSFMMSNSYRDALFEELGIPAIKDSYADLQKRFSTTSHKEIEIGLIKHIIKFANRPIYFSCMPDEMLSSFKDNLYSEGLVLRYSAKPYDNMAVTKRNNEVLYRLDYLKDMFYVDAYQGTVNKMNLNYIVGFKSLLNFYHKSGDLNSEIKLRDMLRAIIYRCSFDNQADRDEYIKHLELAD